MIHEVIVARLPDGAEKKLPYDETTQRVDETALQSFGSVNEIDPSKSAALTLELKPGNTCSTATCRDTTWRACGH